MTRVADLMSSPAITCPGEATLGEIAERLLAHRIHALVVLDDTGAPAGVVSDTDLLAGEWLATDDQSLATMRLLTARDLMTAPPVTIDAEADAVEAATLLRAERLARLVVTEGGSTVGVVAASDLVALLARGRVGRGTVADVMSHGIVVCREQATAAQAARAMTERRSRSLVVVSSHGRPLGVVTGADLLRLVERDVGGTRVQELMHEPLTIGPGATLREAADDLLRREVHRLVVVDPDEPDAFPLGIVSTADIVAEMAAPGSVWG
jgi:CBS domain-containing protein